MPSGFQDSVAKGNASRDSREFLRDWTLREPHRIGELLEMALEVNNKNHHKACWILEIVAEADIGLIRPQLDAFCSGLPRWNHPGAERAGARISLFLADAHVRKRKEGIDFLTPQQFEKLVENAFDRMASTDTFVAAKSLLMRALYKFGQLDDWILPELKDMLERDFASHSVAYQAGAREVLGWLARGSR